MPVSTPIAGRTTWLGLATESTPGTVIATPKMYVPVDQGGIMEVNAESLVPDETRGVRTKPTIYQRGMFNYKGKFKGVWYDNMTLAIARMAFGADTVAAGTDPGTYVHTLKVANTTATHIANTIFNNVWSTSSKTDQYGWGVVDKFKMMADVSKGHLSWEADFMAKSRVYLSGAVPTASYTSNLPHQAWKGTITKGGSSFLDMTKFEWELSNDWEGLGTFNNTQEAGTMMNGDATIKGKFTVIGTEAEFLKFLNDTEEALVITFVGSTLIAGTTYHQNVLTIPKMHVTDAKRNPGGKGILTDVDWIAMYDSVTSTPATYAVTTDKQASDY